MQMLLRNMMIEITIKYNLALYAYDAYTTQIQSMRKSRAQRGSVQKNRGSGHTVSPSLSSLNRLSTSCFSSYKFHHQSD